MTSTAPKHFADHPVLFHVGLHKTGTSWLQASFFSKHPGFELAVDSLHPSQDPLIRSLVLPPDGDFDRDVTRELFARTRRDINTIPVVSAERLSGHPIAGHYDRDRIAERIASAFPQARLLVTVRRQADLIDSIYRQLVREGYPGSIEALAKPNWRLPGFNHAAYEFDIMLSMYQSVIGPESVLMLRHEDMRSDLAGFLRKIESFVGVSDGFLAYSQEDVNRSFSNRETRILRVLNRFRDSDTNRYPVVAIPESWIWRLTRGLAQVLPVSNRAILPAEERARIARRYKISNQRLDRALTKHCPGQS